MLTPEPVLDIVRGLSTVASLSIVLNQLKTMFDELYTGKCENCYGTGKVICQHCAGTKDARRRPGQMRIQDMDVTDNPGDHYPCVYCGPPSQYDFSFEEIDDEMDAINIQDNMRAAMALKTRPHRFPALAGTVPCPECGGAPIIRRHTPNLEHVFNFEEPFWFKVSQRLGGYYIGKENRPASRPRQYLEYPSRPPVLEEEQKKEIKTEAQNDGGFSMSAKDQLTLADYVLPYVDEDDSEVEEDI